jgi:hypothetical protein
MSEAEIDSRKLGLYDVAERLPVVKSSTQAIGEVLFQAELREDLPKCCSHLDPRVAGGYRHVTDLPFFPAFGSQRLFFNSTRGRGGGHGGGDVTGFK